MWEIASREEIGLSVLWEKITYSSSFLGDI